MSTDMRSTTTFSMPSLGADMTEGRITEWLVQPGDRLERGQIVLVVETDKSDIEVEVFEAGTVVEILAAEGEIVPVGAPIARFESGVGRAHSPSIATTTSVSRPDTPPGGRVGPELEHATLPEQPRESGQAPRHQQVTSPVIRHLADELHVDARRLRGTGPGGRVRRDDVEAAARPIGRRRITPRARRLLAARGLDPSVLGDHTLVTGDDVTSLSTSSPPAPTPLATAGPPRRIDRTESMRRHIADLMSRSWDEIPHYHVSKRLDLGPVTERLRAVNETRPVGDRIVTGALLLSAAARAAHAVPACNGWWRDGTFEGAPNVDLGVVLSLRSGGIIVPTIERADELTAGELMVRLDELVVRARQGRLRASDLAEASITVTNLGDRGADTVGGVIHPPQVAIVGFGAVRDEVWPVDGVPTVRPTVHASLAGDHRAIDGMTGSRFLTRLQALLDGPILEDLS